MSSERELVGRRVRWFAGITMGSLAALIVWAVASEPTGHTVHASSSPAPLPSNVASAPTPEPPRDLRTGLSLESFQKITKRCKKGSITEDSVRDQPRFMCEARLPAPHLFEAMGDRSNLQKITVIVPMGGNIAQILKEMMVGIEFFQDVAGRKVGEIAPDGWLKQIATGPTHFEYGGLSYDTMFVPGVGVMYTISKS